MKTLIIGGTGVISGAIVDRLKELGNDVYVFNRGLSKIRYKYDVNVINGDKSNRAEFVKLMSGYEFDAVIDMISYNYDDASITLEAFGKSPHIVFTSTCATYKRPFNAALVKEDFERWAKEESYPYGYHKARMEDYLFDQVNNGYKITIIRPSLTYGIGSKNIGILRNNYGIIERIKNNKPVVVFGDGTTPWDFTFAPDIAKVYAGVLCKELCYGQAYHATSGDVRIWDDLYIEFGKILGIEPKIIHISTEMMMQLIPDRVSHIYQEKMWSGLFDNSKIKSHVPEYQPEYTLDKTLKAIYNWYTEDPEARIIDKDLDDLEDKLVDGYYKGIEIMRANL